MERNGNLKQLAEHLILSVKKGGHGFERSNIYSWGGTPVTILEKVHHIEHGRLQLTLTHKEHEPELQLQRELLLAQYWTGSKWIRAEQPSRWEKLGPETTTGDPDLTRSLFEVGRAFGQEKILIRFITTT